ncbi:MAG TPA: hypothetical protein VGF67_16160 [Ktedonobacteraceae bacterium]
MFSGLEYIKGDSSMVHRRDSYIDQINLITSEHLTIIRRAHNLCAHLAGSVSGPLSLQITKCTQRHLRMLHNTLQDAFPNSAGPDDPDPQFLGYCR